MLSKHLKQFNALSDSNRLRILELFIQFEELSPSLISQLLGLVSAHVAHHTGALKAAGLLNVKKSGKARLYSLNREKLLELAQVLKILADERNAANGNT